MQYTNTANLVLFSIQKVKLKDKVHYTKYDAVYNWKWPVIYNRQSYEVVGRQFTYINIKEYKN
jgi:uncharacterized protein (DUF952 family)